MLLFLAPPVALTAPAGKLQLNIGRQSDYLCYYGGWNEETIFRAQDFDLVILEPSNITTEQVRRLKNGHDGLEHTADDVIVIGYLSVGEDHLANRQGDGRGPCYYSYDSARVIYKHKGLASWYVDDRDGNGVPDLDPVWLSAYVNAGDSLWWDFLKTNPNGADVILKAKQCDGLFLDLLDTASPWAPWPYRWTVVGMSDLVGWLRATYPEKYLIGNRGLFYFDPSLTTAYQHTIRPYVDGIMFESYFIESNRTGWAQKLNTEARKPDGFKVLALDYIAPSDTASRSRQTGEAFGYDWADYISRVALDQIRYDVFHAHAVDTNPPTWNDAIGLVSAVPGAQSVTLQWGTLTDRSLPLQFDIYYTQDSAFSLSTAQKLAGVTPRYDTAAMAYACTVTGLTDHVRYQFLVRAADAAGNTEQNIRVLAATPPSGGDASPITIDGVFGDWQSVPLLNSPPNPGALAGSAADPNADYTAFWAANDADNLFLSYQVAGALSASLFYHVFIDADGSRGTGYVFHDSASIGADLMLESGYLYRYTGTGGGSWSWGPAAGLVKKDGPGRTELKIPLTSLFPGGVRHDLRLLFNVNMAVAPYTGLEMEPGDYTRSSFTYRLDPPNSVARPEAEPVGYELLQNTPNPFNGTTRIQYRIPESGPVTLVVYNVLGEHIATLVDGFLARGTHTTTFSANNVPSGMYIVRLRSARTTLATKMLLLR